MSYLQYARSSSTHSLLLYILAMESWAGISNIVTSNILLLLNAETLNPPIFKSAPLMGALSHIYIHFHSAWCALIP